MTRRRIAALLLAASALGVGVPLLWPIHRVSQATAEQIREGMTAEEVHAILGPPTCDYPTGPPGWVVVFACQSWERVEVWPTGEGSLIVGYSLFKDWKVDSTELTRRQEPAWLEVARWRLRKLMPVRIAW